MSDKDTFSRIERPDLLIHLAWDGLPNYTEFFHFERELPMQYRFLQNLVAGGLKALLVTGTCFEYGMKNGKLDEQDLPDPANPYAFAKHALRMQLNFLKQRTDFALTWARLFYLYGEKQAATSIYAQLRAAAERGDQDFKMSGGEQIRDYLPIATAANYLVSLALQRRDIGVINVCSNQPTSMRRLVEKWIQEEGWSITPALGFHPYAQYEPFAFWGSNTKLREALGADA
jgi:dTDP-6-deoxy-L-talose 4-dehydrogenase (NAD+)